MFVIRIVARLARLTGESESEMPPPILKITFFGLLLLDFRFRVVHVVGRFAPGGR